MNAECVLATVRVAGFAIEAQGHRLHVEPTPSPDLIEQIRAHKSELIELLSSPVRWVDRPDVVLVVEDLADEGWRPRRIAKRLGLTMREALVILRRSGG